MKKFFLTLLAGLITITLASCGGGGDDLASGGGSSGFGGTGISFVKGNVVSINGQTISANTASASPFSSPRILTLLSNLAIAQTIDPRSIRVSGGGVSTTLDDNGRFLLENVAPSVNFELRFEIAGQPVVSLQVGSVQGGNEVVVTNIRIDTNTGSAQPQEISSKPIPGIEKSESDNDDESSDDVSSDEQGDEDDDSDDDDSSPEDDISEDGDSEDVEVEDDQN